MDKTIENKFLEPYGHFGVVSDCISYMRHHYDLGFSPKKKNLSEKWVNYYNVALPKQIIERYNECDNGGVNCFNSPLMNEVESNLCKCKSDAEQKRYLYSLLTPFKEIVSVYNPIAEIKQIEACKSEVTRKKSNIELYTHICNEFRRLTGQVYDGAKWMQEGTVEGCLSDFWCNAHRFGVRLYALLLTYGIDYMATQKECGIYLVNYVHITEIEDFIGTRELAQEYINKLHAQSAAQDQEQPTQAATLPKELDTDKAREVFAKAVAAQLMEIQGTVYKWIGKTRELAYFAGCFNIYIWGKDKKKRKLREKRYMFIWKPFRELFEVENIAQVYKELDFEEVEYPNVINLFTEK